MSDSLKLQVLLKAVDRASRPLNAVQTASRTLSGEIRGAQNELKDLNARARQIEGFRKTSAQLAVTGHALNDAKAQAAALALQMRNTANPTAAQVRALESARQSASALQTTYDSLRLSVQRQRDGLQQAGINTRQLSAAERQLRSNIAQTTDTLTRQRAAPGAGGAATGATQRGTGALRAGPGCGRRGAQYQRCRARSEYSGPVCRKPSDGPGCGVEKSGALIAARQGESSASGAQYTRQFRTSARRASAVILSR